jgi:hypothetical protein
LDISLPYTLFGLNELTHSFPVMDMAQYFRIVNTQPLFASMLLADSARFELFLRAIFSCFSRTHLIFLSFAMMPAHAVSHNQILGNNPLTIFLLALKRLFGTKSCNANFRLTMAD